MTSKEIVEVDMIWSSRLDLHRALQNSTRSSMPPHEKVSPNNSQAHLYHIISFAPCNIKLDASTFSLCKFYVAHGAVVKEPFLTYEPATPAITGLALYASSSSSSSDRSSPIYA